eukprot:6853188-Prymnesium_polylepis.1
MPVDDIWLSTVVTLASAHLWSRSAGGLACRSEASYWSRVDEYMRDAFGQVSVVAGSRRLVRLVRDNPHTTTHLDLPWTPAGIPGPP